MGNHTVGWDPVSRDEGQLRLRLLCAGLDTSPPWLEGRTYVAGDYFTAADVLLASHLQWGMMVGMIEKRRAFEIYTERHVHRPAAKRAEEQAEKLTAQQASKAA